MSIVQGELKRYAPSNVSDTSGNGGRITATELVADVKNNLWPDVPEAERTAGSSKHRKAFYKVANDDDLTLVNAQLWLDAPTAGEDAVFLFAATQRDTQADITGNETLYGAGTLSGNVSATDTELVVDTEDGNQTIFRAGDLLWIGDGSNEEFVTIAAGNSVVYAGDEATLTLTGGLVNAYAESTPTVVASVLEAGNITTTADNYSTSTASGTFDDSGNPVVGDHLGTVEQTWTLTFSSASDFAVAGDVVGSVGSGNISTDFTPNNADFSAPYFTLPSAGWGGTWASSETLTFQTHPAAIPVWHKRVVPAGAASFAANDAAVQFDGESA